MFAEDLHGSHEPFPAILALDGDQLQLTVGTGSAGHGHERVLSRSRRSHANVEPLER